MINVYDVCFNPEDKRLELVVKHTVEENPPSYDANEYDPTFYYGYMVNNFHMNTLLEEHGYAIAFDDLGDPLGIFELSHGNPVHTEFSNREIMERMVLIGAKYYIVFHNHPRDFSGDTTEILNPIDELATRNMVMMGLFMGILCVDHIIIGTDVCKFMSVAEDTSVFQEEVEMYMSVNTLHSESEEEGEEE